MGKSYRVFSWISAVFFVLFTAGLAVWFFSLRGENFEAAAEHLREIVRMYPDGRGEEEIGSFFDELDRNTDGLLALLIEDSDRPVFFWGDTHYSITAEDSLSLDPVYFWNGSQEIWIDRDKRIVGVYRLIANPELYTLSRAGLIALLSFMILGTAWYAIAASISRSAARKAAGDRGSDGAGVEPSAKIPFRTANGQNSDLQRVPIRGRYSREHQTHTTIVNRYISPSPIPPAMPSAMPTAPTEDSREPERTIPPEPSEEPRSVPSPGAHVLVRNSGTDSAPVDTVPASIDPVPAAENRQDRPVSLSMKPVSNSPAPASADDDGGNSDTEADRTESGFLSTEELSIVSPRTGLIDRLSSELHRAGGNQLDVSIALIAGGRRLSEREFLTLLREHFVYRDVLFYESYNQCWVLLPQVDLDVAIQELERLLIVARQKLSAESDDYVGGKRIPRVLAGVSSRNGRIVGSDRLIKECKIALQKTSLESPIVGFRPDPDKYRQFILENS